jgi:hypothetical protein
MKTTITLNVDVPDDIHPDEWASLLHAMQLLCASSQIIVRRIDTGRTFEEVTSPPVPIVNCKPTRGVAS